MPKLINCRGEVLSNPWLTLDQDCTLETALAADSSHLLVPLQLWLAAEAQLQDSGLAIGVWLNSDQDAGQISEHLDGLNLIALNFPAFTDGRAYSTAVRLRQHYGFTGEIRAIGDVLRDQLFYMKRCGFNTFAISDSVRLEDAATAFADFADSYQTTIEQQQPLFLRR